MRLSAAKLRQNLYQVLDLILKNRIPVEVERNGYILKIIPVERSGHPESPSQTKLGQLEPHDIIVGDPEDIIHVDWSNEWKGEVNSLPLSHLNWSTFTKSADSKATPRKSLSI